MHLQRRAGIISKNVSRPREDIPIRQTSQLSAHYHDTLDFCSQILLIEEKTSRLDDKTALMVEQAAEMFSDQRVFNRMKRMKVELD